MDNVTLYDLFECAVRKYPANVAVSFKTATFTAVATYEAVFGECEKVYTILKEYGVKCSCIGVLMEEALYLPAVFLG
jgi:hypothetical protein